MTAKKACKIRMDGVYYTREEWDNVPLTVKLKALLQSPNLEKYMKLGASRLKNGGVFTEVPVAQGAYDNAKSELSRVLDHAKIIRQKIKDVFGKHMDEKQVEYGLIMLDTMAHAWSERTVQLKELYYERYQDVRQTTANQLLDKNAQFQFARVEAVRAFGDTALFDDYARAFEMQEQGVDQERIKLETGWETNVAGEWVYEITDDTFKEVTLSKYPKVQDPYINGEVTQVPYTALRNSELLYQLYPSLSEAKVNFYSGKELPNYADIYGFAISGNIYINLDAHGVTKRFGKGVVAKQTLTHETQHIIQNVAGGTFGANESQYIERINTIFRELEETGELGVNNIFLQEIKDFIEVNLDGEFFNSPKTPEQIEQVAYDLYTATQGEIESRAVESRIQMTPEERRTTLVLDSEDVDRMTTIINRPDNLYYEKGNVNFQAMRAFHGSPYNFDRFSTDNIKTGEGNNTFGWGLYFTSLEEIALDYANKLGTEGNRNFYEVSLHEGKSPSEYTWLTWNQTIPRDVLERIVTNEDAADALFEQVSTTYGLDSNEGLVDAVISEGYTGATVYDILSRYMGDNPSAKNTSLFLLQNGIDGIQYPAGTISGQTSPGVFNYVVFDENAVTIRNRIQFQSQQNSTQYQDLEGNPIEGQPITYPTEFGDLSYMRDENGDIVMVREPLAQTVEQEVNQAIRNRSSDGLVYRAAVEAINNGNEFILYAIDKPDLGSLVHEFMHVAEQDLDDGDLETLERWSGFTKGTTEFREQVADGFVKFISEGSPELNSINAIFNKIAKMLKALYKRVLASPLDIKLNDDVRIIYAKIAGVEQGFTKRLKQATESVQELSDSQRKELLKLSRSLKRYAPSQLSTGTQVVKKDGSIGVVGREDLSGTTAKDRAEGITELLTYPLLVDLAGLYENTNKITPYGKPGITPTCS